VKKHDVEKSVSRTTASDGKMQGYAHKGWFTGYLEAQGKADPFSTRRNPGEKSAGKFDISREKLYFT